MSTKTEDNVKELSSYKLKKLFDLAKKYSRNSKMSSTYENKRKEVKKQILAILGVPAEREFDGYKVKTWKGSNSRFNAEKFAEEHPREWRVYQKISEMMEHEDYLKQVEFDQVGVYKNDKYTDDN